MITNVSTRVKKNMFLEQALRRQQQGQQQCPMMGCDSLEDELENPTKIVAVEVAPLPKRSVAIRVPWRLEGADMIDYVAQRMYASATKARTRMPYRHSHLCCSKAQAARGRKEMLTSPAMSPSRCNGPSIPASPTNHRGLPLDRKSLHQ